MYIILFIVSCISGMLYFWVGKRMKKKSLQITFLINGGVFSIIALILCGSFIYENKTELASVFTYLTETEVNAESNDWKMNEQKMYIWKEKEFDKKDFPRATAVQLQVPIIAQLPELPRGCEVTSLAMLLEYYHFKVDKMKLAKEVKKDMSPYEVIDGNIHFGNPYKGFVGDMYSFHTPGLGVYHGPIRQLAMEYAGERVHDFTGSSFSAILDELSDGRPVWVIINAAYQKLPQESFTTWHTEDGPIEITMRQHAVLITGYDNRFIYFNDPLQRETKASIKDFKAAWIQMGKQAITIY